MPAPKGNTFAKGNKGGGRKTYYKKEYAEQAFKLCLLGADNKRLANFFSVGETTIIDWSNNHKEFSEAIKRGKEEADAEIAHSLYHRAKGYSHKDVDIRVIEGKVVTTEITKQYPPDTAAAMIWLKNRQRDKWRDKQAEDDAPPVVVAVSVTKEEAKDIASAIKAGI